MKINKYLLNHLPTINEDAIILQGVDAHIGIAHICF